jgi:D-glycero-D-manno-heptose 1,7-bisphosphate phosphatase
VGTHGASKGVPAVFLDRDGTLNEMVYDPTHGLLDSPRRPAQVRAVAHAKELLQELREMGFLIVLVTNQPGISKGTLTLDELHAVNLELSKALAPSRWDTLEFCPHHPEFGLICGCRKPLPGMIFKAAQEHGVDLESSWMVGDGLVDVQAGKAAGCRTILLSKLKLNLIERFFDLEGAEPDFVVRDLLEVLRCIRGIPPASKARESS